MKLKPAQTTKINETTYRFTETAFGEKVYLYLLVGKERALLIDTAYGFTDIPAAIKSITDLPLTVVNTHGHMDHMHGNHLYPEVYLSAKDEEVFARHNDPNYLMGLLKGVAEQNKIPMFLLKLPFLHVKEIAASYPSVHRPLPSERFFELGDRRVSVIEMPGHTTGSICLLDEKNGWLFSGDNNCEPGVLLSFPESTSVAVFREGIRKLRALADEGRIAKIFPSHQTTPLGPEHLKKFEAACDAFLALPLAEQKRMRAAGNFNANGLTLALGPNSVEEVGA